MVRIIFVEINEMDVIIIVGIKRRILRFIDVLVKKIMKGIMIKLCNIIINCW